MHGYFIGMKMEELLCRVYEAHTKKVIIMQLSYFKPRKEEKFLGVDSLLDGLDPQRGIDLEKVNVEEAEEGILK